MIKLTNPQYEYPLPVETYFNGFYNSSPKYSDDGRVSMYSENGKDWNDVSELSYVTDGYTLCATGFCLSAFTNPLPESRIASENVRFSIIEGPVALGSKLELSGADEIWYSIDGGAAIRYTKPIILEKPALFRRGARRTAAAEILSAVHIQRRNRRLRSMR